ncbi:hypothetical protein CDD80_4757 [Ophiocordyceps camponoti-rufipedis]|uniref:Checkpoint protein RAD24-like helical bundle domain-containing protein n=1 Tax=Ophiocordyceps camponoti-rufipedis TaxID=2004952 RepID=A0A2C5YWX4_9HYPO|nr:hypothetical protein CDD80_4757 [Ophiocordyceps camponoti-rufipedis]
MSGILSRLVGSQRTTQTTGLQPIEVHQVETDPDRRARCLKHLLKANHVNYAMVLDKTLAVNHSAHLLSAAYLLGASGDQLLALFESETQHLEPWVPAPAEVVDLDWEDFFGDKRYQRAYVDFFEDKLVMDFSYDWKKEVEHFLFVGEKPLFHGLTGGLGHALVHLGYAYEMDCKEIAMEALSLACLQRNFLHKYLDDESYTRPSPLAPDSLLDLIESMSVDERFDMLPTGVRSNEVEALFDEHQEFIMDYWNAWKIEDPVTQLREAQQTVVWLLMNSTATHTYNLSFVHLLATSHALRVLLPVIPPHYHLALMREWWLLVIMIFIIKGLSWPSRLFVKEDIGSKDWAYVEKQALGSRWSKDAHYIKAKRRRRNPVEDSDDEAEQPRATLANYLISSPTRKEPPSPSKNVTAQKRPRRAATQSNGVGPSPKKAASNGRSDEKPKTADLKTLFSKQAQRTTRSATSARTNTPIDDIISDPISEEDEISDLKASSSSLVGQHARKRLKNSSSAGAVEVQSASRKFLKPTKPATIPSVDDDLRPWSERFGPRNLDELAVHKRKVSDVRRWLEAVTAGRIRQRLLVLKGAAGSGKTTTVRLLAQDMGLELLEWKNPAGSRDMLSPSTSAQFDEFLGRGGKFGMLDVEAPGTPSSSGVAAQDLSKRIMLVEEFPNTFSRTSSTLASFRKSILGFLDAAARPKSQAVNPMIVVISETLLTTTSATADSLTAHRLLGPEILRHPGAVVMEFNAIAPTFLAKAMELIVQKEARKSGRRKTPGPMVLNRLGEIGDIRSAISALEFLCLKGDYEADWGAKVAFTKQKKGVRDGIGLTQSEAETLESITQREASLGIFHAVGKVVYNKRDEAAPADDTVETLPSFMAEFARPNRSQVPVDSLIDEIGTDTQTFVSALHENYILSCESTEPMDTSTSMDYVNECIEYLSLSDLLGPSRDVFFGGFGRDSSSSQQLRQDEMTFQVAVRGLLFSLPHPVKRRPTGTLKGGDAFKMFYPTSIKLWKAKEEIEGLVDVWSSRLLRGEDQLGSKNSTDGANAFRKPTTTSWTERAQRQATAANSEVSEARPPMWLGSTARREMVLDRLPYMAHLARARRSGTRDLEKMVAMRGTTTPTDEDEDGDAEVDGSAVEAWATDRPSEEASPRRRRAGVRAGEVSGLMAQKLVLSDDDIEDD